MVAEVKNFHEGTGMVARADQASWKKKHLQSLGFSSNSPEEMKDPELSRAALASCQQNGTFPCSEVVKLRPDPGR